MGIFGKAASIGTSMLPGGGYLSGNGKVNEKMPFGGLINRTLFGPPKAELTAEDEARFSDPNLAANKATLAQRIGNIDSRPQTQIAMAPQEQFRDQQLGLANSLGARVAGRAPSVAEIQMNQGLDQNIQAQMAQAASARGVSAGMNQRNLAQNLAATNQQAVGQGAILRAQEQAAAEQNLGALLGSARGQDVGLATSQAQLSVQEQAQKDALVQRYIDMGFSLDQAQFQAQQQLSLSKLGLVAGNIERQQKSDAALIAAGSSIGAKLATGGAA
jgi:hypothetical protein